eukprot:Nk52_evm12s1737 gene=Nk52_evmTU12s1737
MYSSTSNSRSCSAASKFSSVRSRFEDIGSLFSPYLGDLDEMEEKLTKAIFHTPTLYRLCAMKSCDLEFAKSALLHKLRKVQSLRTKNRAYFVEQEHDVAMMATGVEVGDQQQLQGIKAQTLNRVNNNSKNINKNKSLGGKENIVNMDVDSTESYYGKQDNCNHNIHQKESKHYVSEERQSKRPKNDKGDSADDADDTQSGKTPGLSFTDAVATTLSQRRVRRNSGSSTLTTTPKYNNVVLRRLYDEKYEEQQKQQLAPNVYQQRHLPRDVFGDGSNGCSDDQSSLLLSPARAGKNSKGKDKELLMYGADGKCRIADSAMRLGQASRQQTGQKRTIQDV